MKPLDRNISILEHIVGYCDQIEETIRRFGNDYGVFSADAIYRNAAALCALLKQHFQRVPELKVNQSVSDGNILYQSLGIPTILYGPQGVDFHTEREYLSLSSLEQYMEELEAYIKTRYAGV